MPGGPAAVDGPDSVHYAGAGEVAAAVVVVVAAAWLGDASWSGLGDHRD